MNRFYPIEQCHHVLHYQIFCIDVKYRVRIVGAFWKNVSFPKIIFIEFLCKSIPNFEKLYQWLIEKNMKVSLSLYCNFHLLHLCKYLYLWSFYQQNIWKAFERHFSDPFLAAGSISLNIVLALVGLLHFTIGIFMTPSYGTLLLLENSTVKGKCSQFLKFVL